MTLISRNHCKKVARMKNVKNVLRLRRKVACRSLYDS